jgi:UPF0716 family protein affecting phage T7 exclusion
MARWIASGFLILPIAEAIAFVLVASWIGFIAAALLIVLGSLAGISLLRRAGLHGLAQLRGEIGREPDMSRVLVLGVAGILLVIPGFVTDALAFLVLLPAAQRLLMPWLRPFAATSGSDGTIDLDPAEWRRAPDAELAPPQREKRRDGAAHDDTSKPASL